MRSSRFTFNRSILVSLMASLAFGSNLTAAEDFPIAPNIALTPDAESLGNRPPATPVILSNSAPAAEQESAAAKPGVARDQCVQPAASPYQKSVAMTAFPRTEASSSKPGGLHQVEQLLPELLSQHLQQRYAIITPVQLDQSLATVDHSNNQRLAAQVQGIARNHRTQFVVSGEVLDMSLANPDVTYDPRLSSRVVSGLHDAFGAKTRFDKRDRHFSFQLSLRDGFTGQVLFERRYDTYGIWSVRHPLEVGFGSPLFWKSDYGHEVGELIGKAGNELAAAIRCQPYIARVDARAGHQHIVLHSGANNGLRAGDTLELYQLVMQPINGEYQLYDTRLIKRNTAIELREVYPSHSVAVINSDDLLTGQYLAVAP